MGRRKKAEPTADPDPLTDTEAFVGCLRKAGITPEQAVEWLEAQGEYVPGSDVASTHGGQRSKVFGLIGDALVEERIQSLLKAVGWSRAMAERWLGRDGEPVPFDGMTPAQRIKLLDYLSHLDRVTTTDGTR